MRGRLADANVETPYYVTTVEGSCIIDGGRREEPGSWGEVRVCGQAVSDLGAAVRTFIREFGAPDATVRRQGPAVFVSRVMAAAKRGGWREPTGHELSQWRAGERSLFLVEWRMEAYALGRLDGAEGLLDQALLSARPKP